MTDDPALDCERLLLVQAEIDGELDAAAAAAIAAHRAVCPVCAKAHDELVALSAALRAEPATAPPDEFRHRLASRLAAGAPADVAAAPVRRWPAALGGFAMGCAAAAAVLLAIFADREPDTATLLLDGHLRALAPGHLLDVASNDRHNVKPWFNGRIDFSPVVRNLADTGYPLDGGRLDYLGAKPVAALVYHHAKHVIELYEWPSSSAPAAPGPAATRNGYNFIHWTGDGMELWAVSDLNAAELEGFVARWRAS